MNNKKLLRQTGGVDWDERWVDHSGLLADEHRMGYYALLRKSLVRLPDGATVVEAGSGSGTLSRMIKREFPRLHVVAVDVSDKALACIPKSSKVKTLKADVFALPFHNASVDMIFSDGLFEHFKKVGPEYSRNWRQILDEEVRVTKSGGFVINAVPNLLNIPRTLVYYIQGKKFRYYPAPPSYARGRIYRAYKENGLQVDVTGWAPLYAAKRVYVWDKENRRKIVNWYCMIIRATAFRTERIISQIDTLSGMRLSRYFGWEIAYVGVKQ